MSAKLILQLAAGLGALTVAIGAFGAHGLRAILAASGHANTFETAVRYQAYHTLAVLAVGILASTRPELRGPLGTTALLWLAGIVLFSGSLYALCFTGINRLGLITPLGGVLLIAGWVRLLLAVGKL